jgi:hypothetical protein
MFVKFVTKNIQEKMKAKERAFARSSRPAQGQLQDGYLELNDIASRAVFVRMCSNKSQVPNILISGGEHTDGQMNQGFSNSYRDRTGNDDNSGIRGIPGIKDISVEYKGGFKAIRECTVNWTIPAIEDLDRLTPYFLTVGKTVVVDWGWTYASVKSLESQGIQPFITKNQETSEYVVDQEIFTNPQERVLKANGDYDAIGGTIRNFNYTLRDDGGFDCTTVITAMGTTLFKKPIDTGGNSGTRKVDEKGEALPTPPDNLINSIMNMRSIIVYEIFNVKRSSPVFEQFQVLSSQFNKEKGLNYFDNHCVYDDLKEGAPWKATRFGGIPAFWKPDEQKKTDMFGIAVDDKKNPNVLWLIQNDGVEDIMVTWGWLEDQILSRYVSFKGGSSEGKGIKMTFRSIDTIVDEDGLPIKSSDFIDDVLDLSEEETLERYEVDTDLKNYNQVLKTPTLIRNPELLYPVNPFTAFIPETNLKISVSGGVSEVIDEGWVWDSKDPRADKFLNEFLTLFDSDDVNLFYKKQFRKSNNFRKGKLRNIWVNVKDIQRAFGMQDPNSKDNTSNNVSPPGTVENGVRNLLSTINSNFHNVWDFDIVADPFDSTNIKVIDKSDTDVDLPAYTTFQNNNNSHKVQDLGLYKFPSYKIGSIVKNQTLEFKIPDAQALTILYGSNKKKGESDDQFSNGVLDKLLRMNSGSNGGDPYKDKYLQDLETSNIGATDNGDDNIIYTRKVGSEKSDVNSTISDDFGLHINPDTPKYNWRQFEPDTEDSGVQTTSKNKVESYTVTQDKNNKPKIQYSITEILPNKNPKGEPKKKTTVSVKSFYKYNSDEKNIILEEGAQGALKSFLNSSSPQAQFDMNSLVPAELGLEVDGTGGILPGDIIHTDYIQDKYKAEMKQVLKSSDDESESISAVGPLTYFQMFGVTQKVDPSGWTTELQTKMRINKMPSNNLAEYKPPKRTWNSPKTGVNNVAPIPRPSIPIESEQEGIAGDVELDDLDFGDYDDWVEPPPRQIPAPISRPNIPVPPDDEDIADDVELDDLEFDDIPPWIPPSYPSTLALRKAKQEVENVPEKVPGGDIPPDLKMIDVGDVLSPDQIDNLISKGVTQGTTVNNDTDMIEYPPEPDPKLAPVLPTTPLQIKRNSDYDLNPLSLLDQIKSQKIIYVQPKIENEKPVNQVPKAQRFEAPVVEELVWDSPVTVVELVNENIKKESPPTEVKVVNSGAKPREEIVVLKSTYDPTIADWSINPTYKLIYKIVPGWYTKSANNPKNTDFYGEGPTNAVNKSIRKKFWDEIIEAPNETGISDLNTPAKIEARLKELGDTYANLGPGGSWTPITGIPFAVYEEPQERVGQKITLP